MAQVWFQNRRQRLHKRKRPVNTTSPSAAEPPAKKAAAEPARSEPERSEPVESESVDSEADPCSPALTFYTDDFGAELPLLWLDELDVCITVTARLDGSVLYDAGSVPLLAVLYT